VTVPKKILVCFLLSAFLFAGIAALAFTGFFDYYGDIANEAAEMPMLVAVFLTLFLIIFFCFNLRQDSTGETRTPGGDGKKKPVIREHSREASPLNGNKKYEKLEELEAVVEESYLTEFGGADMMPEDITGEIVQLEAIGGLRGISMLKPFTFSQGNPELLQEAGSEEDEISANVFYEQDGIHYINSNAFTPDNVEKLDSNFAKLVESVVNKD